MDHRLEESAGVGRSVAALDGLLPPAGAEGLSAPPALTVWHVAGWVALAGLVAGAAGLDAAHGWLAGVSSAPVRAHGSLILLALALGCEFMDSALGMGYGTTLAPVLIILGYPVKAIVPAILVSQLLANVSVSFFHHRLGNVDFWKDRQTRNAGVIMGAVGMAVSVATMLLAVRIQARLLRIAITSMVIGIGLFLLLASRFNIRFRMRNVGILAGAAAFNKAFSGGGYGPLVAGGQVLVGLPARAAVVTTAIAEAIVCASAVVAYYASGRTIPPYLLVPLLAGALLGTPLGALTLRRLPEAVTRRLMAAAILALGTYALIQGKGV